MKHLVDLKQISILLLLGLFVACSGDSNETANSTQSTPAPAVETEEELVARARGIHDRVITLDTHADINLSLIHI